MHGVTKHAIVYPNHCVANVPKLEDLMLLVKTCFLTLVRSE